MGMLRKSILPFILILLLCCAACASDTREPESPPPETATESAASQPVTPASEEPTAKNTGTARPSMQPEAIPTPDEPSDTPSDTPSAEIEKPTPAASPSQTPTPVQTPPQPDNRAPPSPDDGPVILTISGDGVRSETVWTLTRLQALTDGYREYTYSTTNNWPSYGYMTTRGISLPYLLRQAGVLDNAASFKLTSADGYHFTVTYSQIFGSLYTYANHSPGGSSGASAVEPVVAWAWGEGNRVREENIRPFFGQNGPVDVNTATFVKDLCRIEVSTGSAGSWAAPNASIASGTVVAPGTELALLHDGMDSVRIYYTLDGSEPDYNSLVYNPSASYFQPELTTPIILEQSVTIKAFAAAFGKDKSPVVTFSYTVEP